MPQTPSKLVDPARAQWFIAVFVLVLFGLFLAWFIQHERGLTLNRERDRLFTQVRVIDALLKQQLVGVREAMLSMRPKDRVSPDDTVNNPERSATLRVLTDAMPAVRTMLMIDPQGVVVSSSRTETLGFDASRRDYFQAVKTGPRADALYVSAPFTTSLGAFAINLSKAWTGDQNRLLGVTTATLDPAYFKVFLNSVRYAEDMRATIAHADGVAFLTQPENVHIQGANLTTISTLFPQHTGSGREESYFQGDVSMTGDRRPATGGVPQLLASGTDDGQAAYAGNQPRAGRSTRSVAATRAGADHGLCWVVLAYIGRHPYIAAQAECLASTVA
jgi:hypothetical protein